MVTWQLGITTAPRNYDFLSGTIMSLIDSGWSFEHITVFAEPDSERPQVPVGFYQHGEQLGPWCNWRFALQHLAKTGCGSVAIVQDDLEFRSGLRDCLDEAVTGTAVFSPYLSKKDASMLSDPVTGWRLCGSGWNLCGACFFAMTVNTAAILDSVLPFTVPENKHIDAQLGKILQTLMIPLYVHNPSLVQHLADEHSTMGYARNPYCRTAHGYEPIKTSE